MSAKFKPVIKDGRPSDIILEVSIMKLVPLADRVLLKPVEAMETTASGIILSTATKEKPVVSEVVAVGPAASWTETRSRWS